MWDFLFELSKALGLRAVGCASNRQGQELSRTHDRAHKWLSLQKSQGPDTFAKYFKANCLCSRRFALELVWVGKNLPGPSKGLRDRGRQLHAHYADIGADGWQRERNRERKRERENAKTQKAHRTTIITVSHKPLLASSRKLGT